MLILGISTSAKIPSAAVMRDGEIISHMSDVSGRSHSVTIMELIDAALSKVRARLDDVDCIAVDIGPGSFTGVRIGVSVANGIAFAINKPILPVTALAALRNTAGNADIVCAMIDARNGNGYAAVYEGEVEKLSPFPCIIDEAIAALPQNTVIVGDCCGQKAITDATLVLLEAKRVLKNNKNALCSEAHPLYLRPSQAERMRAIQHSPRYDI